MYGKCAYPEHDIRDDNDGSTQCVCESKDMHFLQRVVRWSGSLNHMRPLGPPLLTAQDQPCRSVLSEEYYKTLEKGA